MNKHFASRQNNSTSAAALQITLAVARAVVSAILFPSTHRIDSALTRATSKRTRRNQCAVLYPLLLLVLGILIMGNNASADDGPIISFTKIADTNTPIPGGTGNFTVLFNTTDIGPSLSKGRVAFGGQGTGGQRGIYTSFGGYLEVIADANTPVPGGPGNFTDFGSGYTNGGYVGFRGFDSLGNTGIYTNVGGLHVIADTNTPIPGDCLPPANFVVFSCAACFALEQVGFCGRHPSGVRGVFTDIGNGLSAIADTCTAIPGGTGNFTDFDIFTPFNGSAAAFIGFGSGGQTGVYSNVGGLHVIANTTTVIPGGLGNFTSFGGLNLDGLSVAFVGFGSNGQTGVYTDAQGLHRVADTHTPIPGGTGNFVQFGFFYPPALRNGHVVFAGYGSGGQIGLYTERTGSLRKVIAAGDTFDGKTVTAPYTGPRSLDGDQLVLICDFADSSSGVYLLTLAPSPAAEVLNLSTRMLVQAGDNAGIGGFIITGTAPKHVLLRAIGPSLAQSGVPDALADPVLELHGPGSFATITNDNWRDDPVQEALIEATGIPPINDFESAIEVRLAPGAYTAIVRGNGDTSGVALVEVYDLNPEANSKLANISTRAFVSTGDKIVIAGFTLGNDDGDDAGIVLRGIGPSLAAAGVPDALADPTLELRNSNGALLVANNDWQDNPAQAAELTAAGLAPTNQFESGIAATLPPSLYTALLAGQNNGTGVGLVEVYDLGPP